ncbi:MAG: hypothetical protein D6800_11610 [Candidatus Zixiibacteriota bacterium]|nr:MAG: hypothetical protein D6800_11610 [candidate division Zixibacteria bacterium]
MNKTTEQTRRLRTISARFPVDLAQDLAATAQARGCTMTKLLIEGVKRRIEELNQEAGTHEGTRPFNN